MHTVYHNQVGIHYNSDYSGIIYVSSPGKEDVRVIFSELMTSAFDEDQTVWNSREIDAIEKFVGEAAINLEISRLEQLPPERALDDVHLVWGLNEMVKKLTS